MIHPSIQKLADFIRGLDTTNRNKSVFIEDREEKYFFAKDFQYDSSKLCIQATLWRDKGSRLFSVKGATADIWIALDEGSEFLVLKDEEKHLVMSAIAEALGIHTVEKESEEKERLRTKNFHLLEQCL